MKAFLLLMISCFFASHGIAQSRQLNADSIMITIFLKHQQDKNLDSLQVIQKKNRFGNMFPPKGARIVSWYVIDGYRPGSDG